MTGCGCDCGVLVPPSVIGPPGPVPVPGVQDIIAAANIVAGWDAADLAASPVALWPDASGNGFDLAQAVALFQPTWGAATGPNGQSAVLFDGVNDFMANGALNLPAPGTTPTYFWGVLRNVTWTTGRSFWIAGTGEVRLLEGGVTPQVFPFNGNFVNDIAMTLNVYGRIEVFFNNAASDYFKYQSVSVTGGSYGNVDAAAGFTLGTEALSFANIQVCELWIFNALPTPTQIALLDGYVAARYGSGLT